MKTLIFSDLHGKIDVLNLLINGPFKEVDTIICLGDNFNNYKNDPASKQNAEQLINILLNYNEKNIEYIKGNCDDSPEYSAFYSKYLPDPFLVKEVNELRIVFTHGHLVENDEQIKTIIEDNLANIIISGHTHLYGFKVTDNYIYINPGSTSFPRDVNSLATYLIFDDELKLFTIKEINTHTTVEELSIACA